MKKLLVFAFVFLLSISFAAAPYTACDGTSWDYGSDGTGVFTCTTYCGTFGRACVAEIQCEYDSAPCAGGLFGTSYDDSCGQVVAGCDSIFEWSCVCDAIVSAPEFPSKLGVFLVVLVAGLLVSFKAPISRAFHRKK